MTTGSFRGRASYFPEPRGVIFSRREENRLGHIVTGTRFGPYEIGALVGTGGMAEVYRAQDTRLDRTVAVKVLASHLSDDAGLRQRFEREAETISSLNHPHICILFDVGREDLSVGPVDFLVMEYLEGETLAARLKRGALTVDESLRIAIQIASDSDFLSSPRRVTSGRRAFKCVLGPVFGVQTKTK